MKRFAVLGAGMLLLGGCALPVPLQVASWALDGISYLMTEKSVTDHGLSVLAQKDCAMLRGILDPDEFCRDFDDSATALADGMSYDSLFKGEDETIGTEVDAIAEFETASGGDTDVTFASLKTGADTKNAFGESALEVSIDENVETAAAQVSADVILYNRISLLPAKIVVTVAGEANEEILLRQQAALGDVEDFGVYENTEVAEVPAVAKPDASGKDWLVRTVKIMETGLEPAAGLYYVIGSFRDHGNARKLRKQYRDLRPSVLAASLQDLTVYRVVVGPFGKTEEKAVYEKISEAGIADSWAIQVKPGDWRMALVDPPADVPIELAEAKSGQAFLEWSAVDSPRMLARLAY